MTLFRVAVVEDEPSELEQLCAFLMRYGKERGQELEISAFRDGSEILSGYKPVYDIIFLDIEMPQIDGMEAAGRIRRQDPDVVLVFITNIAQYAIQGYSVGALDYVLKPVSYYTFCVKLDRAVEMCRRRAPAQIILAVPHGAVRLDVRQIYYVDIQNRQLHYHTGQGDYTLRGTMHSAESQLGGHHFVRCNYWYLVNLFHVSEVRKDIVVVAGHELEISRRNKTAFLTALTDYVGGGG